MGGEGKSTIDGLSKIPPVAEIRKPKSGLWSPRVARISASKIAPEGDGILSDSIQDQEVTLSQLKLSPIQPSLDSKVIGNVEEVSKSEYSLENSDLFRVKLEPRNPVTDNQRHLVVNNFDRTIPIVSEDKPVLQPSQNPNYNPAVASAPEESNFEGEMGTVGTSYRRGVGMKTKVSKLAEKIEVFEKIEVIKEQVGPPVLNIKELGPKNDKDCEVVEEDTPELKRVFRRMNLKVGPVEREKSVENWSSDVSLRRGRDTETRELGVKMKIDAYERLNEGQRSLKKSSKLNQPSPKVCKMRAKTIEKGGMKGGISKTPNKLRPKLKPQKFNLMHFWGQRGDGDGGLSESN